MFIGKYIVCRHHFTVCNFNLTIRVGEDGEEIEKNAICADQIDLTASGAAIITCFQILFGDWISISKSSSNVPFDYMVLEEVRVFGSGYNGKWNRTVRLSQRCPEPIKTSPFSTRHFPMHLWYTYYCTSVQISLNCVHEAPIRDNEPSSQPIMATFTNE